MDADHISNLARYARDGRIATVKIGEEACLDGLDPSRGIMHLMVESPVPSTPDFPNVYIADHFVILHGMYNHSLSVSAYDAEGDPLPSEDDDTAVALMDELTERDANGEVRFSDDAMTQVLLARLSKLREQRVGRLLLEFPEDLAEFDPSKQIEHILNQLRWLSRLTVLDEVGMSVEPYLRD